MEVKKQQVEEWVRKVFGVCGVLLPPDHLVTYYASQILIGNIDYKQVQSELLNICGSHPLATTTATAPASSPPSSSTTTSSSTSSIPTVASEHQSVQPQPHPPSFPSVANVPTFSSAYSPTPPVVLFGPATQPSYNPQSASGDAAAAVAADNLEEEKLKIKLQIGGAASANPSQTEKIKDYVNELYKSYTGRIGDPASTNYLVTSLIDKTLSLIQAEYFVKFSNEAKAFAKTKAEKQKQLAIDREAKTNEYVKELFRVYAKNNNPTAEEILEYATGLLDGTRKFQEVEDEFKLMSLSPP